MNIESEDVADRKPIGVGLRTLLFVALSLWIGLVVGRASAPVIEKTKFVSATTPFRGDPAKTQSSNYVKAALTWEHRGLRPSLSATSLRRLSRPRTDYNGWAMARQ